VVDRANGLDPKRSQALQKLGEHLVLAQGPGGCKAAPERPARALEHPLPRCVVLPAVMTMELVTIAFNRQPCIPATLDHQVNAIGSGLHLGDDAIAA